MSKKFFSALFVLFISATIFAQDLPRIAVYVTGNVPDDDKKALGTRMLSTLVNSGRYRGIERSGAFLAKIEEEQEKQRSGAIDDNQISELGKQFGVEYVCIADITPAFGAYQVSARVINVETAEVEFIGDASGQLTTLKELELVSDRVVQRMFRDTTRTQTAANISDGSNTKSVPLRKPKKRRTRIGVKSAYNMSNANVNVYSTDHSNKIVTSENHAVGHGVELGLVTSTGFWRHFFFQSGADLIFREPVNSPHLNLRETALAIPALLRIGGGPPAFGGFAETGLRLDFALSGIDNRSVPDLGFVLGTGFYLGRRIEMDTKIILGTADFADVPEQRGKKLFQYSIGLTVMLRGRE